MVSLVIFVADMKKTCIKVGLIKDITNGDNQLGKDANKGTISYWIPISLPKLVHTYI